MERARKETRKGQHLARPGGVERRPHRVIDLEDIVAGSNDTTLNEILHRHSQLIDLPWFPRFGGHLLLLLLPDPLLRV